jgi:hypothetical protein
MMRDHIATSLEMTVGDAPFADGRGKAAGHRDAGAWSMTVEDDLDYAPFAIESKRE